MKRGRLLLPLCLLAGPLQQVEAAPISFNTALPVDEGGWVLRTEAISMRVHDDPSPMGRRMDVLAVPLVAVYGATSKLALMGVFPYMDKKLTVGATGAQVETSGLGDIMTVARYEILQRNAVGRTTRGALFAGLKWPSGNSTASSATGRLPPPVQSGSGSYDPLIGTVWTAQWLSAELDADLSYQRNTRANDFKFGDVLTEDVSLQYRLWPRELKTAGVPSYLYGVLEANGIYQAKNATSGVDDDNSGGYQLFLTPGLQWVTKRAVFEVAEQLPVVQSMHGSALKSNYNLIGSFRVRF